MFNFDKSDIQRVAVSSVGAIALSAACIIGVAGPARAATPAAPAALTVSDWQNNVERQLDKPARGELADLIDGPSKAELKLTFTADGDYAGAQVVRSTGNRKIDRHAVKIADAITYPGLPAGYRGTAQTVNMNLYFGTEAPKVEKNARAVQFAALPSGGAMKVAAK